MVKQKIAVKWIDMTVNWENSVFNYINNLEAKDITVITNDWYLNTFASQYIQYMECWHGWLFNVNQYIGYGEKGFNHR